MDFALTQEQRMVYEYGDRVSQRFDHKYWKAYAEKSEPPAELYKQITDDGFLGIMVPEASWRRRPGHDRDAAVHGRITDCP